MNNIIKSLKESLMEKPARSQEIDKTGSRAESIALSFLKHQGLKYLQRNFNCKAGEIDLIFREQQCLVFVEVRYRKNSYFGSPAATVDNRKQQKVIRAALTYLQSKNHSAEQTPIRFDVIQLLPAAKPRQATIIDSHAEKTTENTVEYTAKKTVESTVGNDAREQAIIFQDHQISWIKGAFTG